MGDELDLDFFRQLLEQRLAEVQRLSREEPPRDRADATNQLKVGRLARLDALQQQAMLDTLHARNSVEHERLRRALLRLHDGDYGYCSLCAKAIAPARLQLDPASVLCLSCAELAERQLQ